MRRKRIFLITGATGFIGSCLLRKLIAQKEKVHIILRKESNLWRIKDLLDKTVVHFDDLSNLNQLSRLMCKIRPNIIYHLATYGGYSFQDDADLCIKTNFAGVWNLLKATSKIDYELFVNTGSSSEYGFKNSSMKESDCLEPASYYAVTKSSQTLLCSYFANENKKPIVTLRPFSVYGQYEDKNRFIPTLLKSLYDGKPLNLVSADIVRDWIYVEDMIDSYLLIDQLKKYGGEIFNIGTGIQTTIKDVAELAAEVTGRTIDFRCGEMKNRKWDSSCWVADMSKAKEKLKWSPKIGLRQGLCLTWDWFKKKSFYYS